jgi:hypothetical protein
MAGEAVAATPHRQFKAHLAGETDDTRHGLGISRPYDRQRLPVIATEVTGPLRGLCIYML